MTVDKRVITYMIVLDCPVVSFRHAGHSHLTMLIDPDDSELELLGVDELTIRRLRKSDSQTRRERMDREIKDLMKQSYGR